MRLRSRSVTVTHPTERGHGATRGRGLLADDQVDHRGERHELAVAEPPLRLAHVARCEVEVAITQAHRDGDQIALLAFGAGPGGVRHRASSLVRGSGGDHSTALSYLESAACRSLRPPASPRWTDPGDGGGDRRTEDLRTARQRSGLAHARRARPSPPGPPSLPRAHRTDPAGSGHAPRGDPSPPPAAPRRPGPRSPSVRSRIASSRTFAW